MQITVTREIQVRGLGKKIERARKLSHLTWGELCAKAEISVMQWRRIEREDYAVPVETLNRVLIAVGLNPITIDD